jgi:hypothetical protein
LGSSYENAFLNSLLRDPLFQRCRLSAARDAQRDDIIVRVIQCILEPLLLPATPARGPNINPQLLRELTIYGALKPEKHAAQLRETLAEPGLFEKLLRSSLSALLTRETYLTESDLAEIEHWDAYLGREDLRMAGRRIAFHCARIRPADKRRFPIAEEAPEAQSELEDAGVYPQGGFSELSTRGRPENLVPSELIYLGEGNLTDISQEELRLLQSSTEANSRARLATPMIVDLFAYRFVTQELLYYLRESGTLRRVRRTVHFVFEPDPQLPDPESGYQGLRWREPGLRQVRDRLVVIIMGLAIRLARDLGAIFSDDALRFEIHVLARSFNTRTEAERDVALLSALLEHEIKKERVLVDLRETFDARQCIERGRRSYVISVQYKDLCPPGFEGDEPIPRKLRAVALKLGGNQANTEEGSSVRPEKTQKARPADSIRGVEVPLDDNLLEAIHEARDGLLSEITGSRSRR